MSGRRPKVTGENLDSDAAPPLRKTAGHMLRRAHQIAAANFTSEVDGILSPSQFSTLLSLCQEPGMHQIDLIPRIAADRSTVNDVVARLEKKGLLEKRRSREDERKIALYVTKEGVAAVAQALPGSVRAHDRLLERIPPKLREPFLQALEHLLSSEEE